MMDRNRLNALYTREEPMGNRHHAHILQIDGADVERISDSSGKSYLCRTCGSDKCRHIKRAREADSLHIAQDTVRSSRG
jgi:hypothetical protein